MAYPGGKNGAGTYQRIICQIPQHRVYVEGCLGSGAIMRYKKPAEISYGFDLDGAAIANFNYPRGHSQIHLAQLDILDVLEHRQVPLSWPETFVYLDPPYVRSSRKSPNDLYRFEWTDEQHQRLLEILQTLPAMVAVSGYFSEMYAKALKDWRVITFQSMTRQGPATEYLWMNYPEPQELHDYRYLGENFTKRQHIKRKKQRWINKLAAMPALERYALLDAIDSWKASQNQLGGPQANPSYVASITPPGDLAESDFAVVPKAVLKVVK